MVIFVADSDKSVDCESYGVKYISDHYPITLTLRY